MAILRSRAASGLSTIANPSVQSALQEWERKLQAARDAGRQSGLQEAAARIAEAERRAAGAEAKSEEQASRRQADFLARFEPLLATIAQVAAKLEPLEKQLVQEAESQSVRLALAIAATVLRRSIEHDQEWLASVVKHALAQIPDRRSIAIRMHPADAAVLRDRLRDLTARITGIEHIEVVDDSTLPRGSCILQSRGTRLDASVPGCWERIGAELIDLAPSSDCTIPVRPGDAPAPGGTKA
jgi:flagellar assembly protein FliH